MTDDEIRNFVLRLSRPELEVLRLRLDIDPGYLGESAPAARAAEIWQLATRPSGAGVGGIRQALQAMHPKMDFQAEAPRPAYPCWC